MDRIIETYRDFTLESTALEHRAAAAGKWSGSYVISKNGVEIERVAVAGPLDSEAEATENAIRVARDQVDQRLDA